MKNEKLSSSGKAVLNDVVKLAQDTGTLIYELYSHIAALVKSALDKNAAKKSEQTATEPRGTTE